jgi:antitoxin PrlF
MLFARSRLLCEPILNILIFQKSIYHPTHTSPRRESQMTNKRECCRIDAIVNVDSKGQIVLPKDLREKADIKANDKLALMGVEQGGALCCIVMMKADSLGDTVKGMLGPMLNEAFKQGGEEE